MDEKALESLKEFQKIGFGLAEPGHLDAVIEEFKRTEKFLRALGGYDLAIYRIVMELYAFESIQSNRKRG